MLRGVKELFAQKFSFCQFDVVEKISAKIKVFTFGHSKSIFSWFWGFQLSRFHLWIFYEFSRFTISTRDARRESARRGDLMKNCFSLFRFSQKRQANTENHIIFILKLSHVWCLRKIKRKTTLRCMQQPTIKKTSADVLKESEMFA